MLTRSSVVSGLLQFPLAIERNTVSMLHFCAIVIGRTGETLDFHIERE